MNREPSFKKQMKNKFRKKRRNNKLNLKKYKFL